jgi:hypothetical protein
MGVIGMRKPTFASLKENPWCKEIDMKPGEECQICRASGPGKTESRVDGLLIYGGEGQSSPHCEGLQQGMNGCTTQIHFWRLKS